MRRFRIITVLVCAGALPRVSSGADATPADAVIGPGDRGAARLVVTGKIEIPYGHDAASPGFAPAGDEREARGPNAIEVTDDGIIRLSDSLHRTIFAVRLHASGRPSISVLGALPPRPSARSGGVPTSSVRVVKTSGEDGAILLSVGGVERRVAVETGGPLASIRLLGVDRSGRTFVLLEKFREHGRTAVDRELLVVDGRGGLVARAALAVPPPIVPPLNEMFLTADGALFVLSAGEGGARVLRLEVRP